MPSSPAQFFHDSSFVDSSQQVSGLDGIIRYISRQAFIDAGTNIIIVSSPRDARINLKPGIYLGAGISALLLLLPYTKLVFASAFVLGPLAGVWFEIWRTRCHLNFTQGALLGLQSAFYGAMTAIALDQIISRVFHEQLWRLEKLYQLPPLIASKGLDSDTPTAWYLFLFVITVIAIFAGAIGAPSGMLGVKLFQRSPRP